MTDSAAITRSSQEYLDALRATTTVTADQDAYAFVDPAIVGSKGISAIIKQNNFLVQISTTILRKLTELEERVQRIEQQAARIEQGKAAVALPDDAVQQLIKGLKGTALTGAFAGSSQGKKASQQGPIVAYKNPYKILEEEQAKLKK